MSIFDIEEQPITPKDITELGFTTRLFPSRYVKTYQLKEENISISYSVALYPHGESWMATLSITYFGFRMMCTSIAHAGGVFVSNKAAIWSSLDMHGNWKIPPLEINVNTLNDLIILTSGECVKQHCKEFITNDKILW
jgi:hypothetical protein